MDTGTDSIGSDELALSYTDEAARFGDTGLANVFARAFEFQCINQDVTSEDAAILDAVRMNLIPLLIIFAVPFVKLME